ncbi:MAG: peptidoglycan-binding protein [Leptolyngbyaceae cyanobacterium CRU_2_3]|nr:peptidoglycan-binding protein [Leptolyngbyaceae cyanobacterium CRU_2_3]
MYGTGTYNAVVAYQRAIGVTADGVWGPRTAEGTVLARS